jgi:DNA invertase Pin-like site-specific DNA recombinase
MTDAIPCAIYARVSTTKQGEQQLSHEDQLAQGRAYVAATGGTVVREFIESRSGRDGDRPVFQEMVELACGPARPFKKIIVHSWSRYMRNEIEHVIYKKRLAKHGVTIHALTQDFGTGPGAELATRIVALMDEMQSEETSKHVSRTMKENARQGFHNGTTPPYGYISVAAENRGARVKKKLAVDPHCAEIVKLVFKLRLEGDGKSGPLGIRLIARWLNAHGYKPYAHNSRISHSKKFYSSLVDRILRNEACIGRYWYNRKDRLGNDQPRSEWIEVKLPPIISEETFRRTQILMRASGPKVVAPRIDNSPVILGGLGICGSCGGQLVLGTGTSKSGVRFRYYWCANKVLNGKCEGGHPASIREDKLDKLVVESLCSHILTPARIREVVAALATRRASGRSDLMQSLARLRTQLKQTKNRIEKLLDAVADGLVEDTEVFRQKFKALEADRENLGGMILGKERTLEQALKPITLEKAEEIASDLRSKLSSADPALKKRYVRAFVAAVIVTPEDVLLLGPNSSLAEVTAGVKIDAVTIASGVLGLDREWWAVQDKTGHWSLTIPAPKTGYQAGVFRRIRKPRKSDGG